MWRHFRTVASGMSYRSATASLPSHTDCSLVFISLDGDTHRQALSMGDTKSGGLVGGKCSMEWRRDRHGATSVVRIAEAHVRCDASLRRSRRGIPESVTGTGR